MKLLPTIQSPADLKPLSSTQLVRLAAEIREKIIETVSETGGHLASGLGTVELAIALHKVFESPRDKIVWDVGHQAYPHKLLTGRFDRFHTLRQFGGISGFLKREESPHDCFGAGHSSTSISAAVGFAKARDTLGEKHKVVAVIGDGSMTSGMAFEGLNHAGQLESDLLIVLNDNTMSISPNVGALSNYLNRIITGEFYNFWKRRMDEVIRSIPRYGPRIRSLFNRFEEGLKGIIVPGILFEEMGLRYFGPIDGHNLDNLIEVFEKTKNINRPKIVHLITTKGKGFELAEKDPLKWHGAKKFDKVTGEIAAKSESGQPPTYTEVFSDIACELAEENERIVAITAAMCVGTGLTKFQERFPKRFYDIGIAEQHGVTLAGGLALGGMRPLVAIYSTFLQRAYDQILHDICLQKLPIVFALDRAGIVGADGPTHHGLFDVAFLRHIPNIVLMAPTDELEMRRMFRTAFQQNLPCVIRYPRAAVEGVPIGPESKQPIEIGRAKVLQEGSRVAILVYGTILREVRQALPILKELGIEPTLVNARFAKPLDKELIRSLAERGYRLVTVEEHALAGGFGSAVLELLEQEDLHTEGLMRIGVPDRFVEHGDRSHLLEQIGMNPENIAHRIAEFCSHASRSGTCYSQAAGK